MTSATRLNRAAAFTASPSAASLALLGSLTAAAWAALVADPGVEAAGGAAFLLGWLLMMTAMMLPSVAPLVNLLRRDGRPAPLLAGYLLVWLLAGIPVYALHRTVDLMMVPPAVAGAILVGAGVYQLTPLKTACLRHCRSPATFLMQRFGRSPLRLGVEHGAYCVGCCWGLMAVLVGAGAMELVWAAAIALVVFAEKVLPGGEALARLSAGVLIAGGVAVLVV